MNSKYNRYDPYTGTVEIGLEAKRYLTKARLLAKNEEFQKFILKRRGCDRETYSNPESAALSTILEDCGVDSLNDLAMIPEALHAFERLDGQFRQHILIQAP